MKVGTLPYIPLSERILNWKGSKKFLGIIFNSELTWKHNTYNSLHKESQPRLMMLKKGFRVYLGITLVIHSCNPFDHYMYGNISGRTKMTGNQLDKACTSITRNFVTPLDLSLLYLQWDRGIDLEYKGTFVIYEILLQRPHSCTIRRNYTFNLSSSIKGNDVVILDINCWTKQKNILPGEWDLLFIYGSVADGVAGAGVYGNHIRVGLF